MGTMKKRMLALLLTLTIIVGLGGQAWAEVLPGVESTSPEVSTQPENSASPEGTEAPQETTAPEETDPSQEEPQSSAAVPSDPSEEGEDPVQPSALSGVETYSDLPSGEIAFPEHVIDGVSPVGTSIDLFDYWIWGQTHTDNDENLGTEFLNSGINAGHAFVFGKSLDGNTSGIGTWNQWTRNASPYTGIVASKLGEDGYPRLNLDLTTATAHAGKDGQESLAYLFDPDVASDGKQSFEDVRGLLQMDEEGYFYYNSQENYAVYFQDTNSFVLYEYPGVQNVHGQRKGQFFPFNAVGWDNLPDNPGNYFFPQRKPEDSNLNHYFGVHMTTRFVQQNNGYTTSDSQTPVTYEFSGDDDVWIFIDGTLVADLGGIHDMASVSINFVNGDITINGVEQEKKLGSILGYNSDTLPDGTFHTLDFFYLERGNVESNMSLKYNLVTVPESSIIKVDQTGDRVPGAGFQLYLADQGYQKQENPIAAGSTDSRGQLVLLDDMGNVISLQEIWTKMDNLELLYDSNGEQRGNLVLVESAKPEGYRSTGDVQLYLVNINGKVLLLSDNYWDTGAYAYTNSTVVMDGTVTSGTGESAELEQGGTLFAVVLRRTTNVGTEEPSETDLWSLVTGNATDGWHTSEATPSGQNGIAQLLTELKKTENRDNYFVAMADASGMFKISASDLPGEITSYYYVLGKEEKAKTEYILAFYYTTASGVAEADSTNTWRVKNSDKWSRVFSANVHVPNIKNRLFVQKLAPDGTAVAGAEFTLYNDDYYLPDGRVNPNATSQGTVTTQNLTKEGDGILLDGGGVFPLPGKVLPSGTYYLVEKAAPQGYDINPTATKIVVDNTGVYADAGGEDDGVVVARGMGSIVKSMAQFASLGDIDVTLNNIVARFYTVPSSYISETTQDFSGLTWRKESNGAFVANKADEVTYHPSYMYDESSGKLSLYDANDATGKLLLGLHMQYSATAGLEYDPGITLDGDQDARHWMTTDTGWSKLMMEQCLTHSQEMQEERYHVTDLTSPKLYDLTNLFSGTVIVQVTDQHTTSLTINKQVDGVNDGDVASQNYTFTVTSSDKNYSGTVQIQGAIDADGRPVTSAAFKGGVLTVSCTGTGTIQISNLADGTYTVTENTTDMDDVMVNGDTYVWQNETYTSADDNVEVTATNATAAINSDSQTTANASVTITNLYAGAQPLIVTKTVGGTMGDTTKDFTFTLSLQDTDDTQEITATKSGAGMTQPVTFPLTLTQSGNYTFTLKHHQQVVIQIPYDSQQVKVTEAAELEYTTDSRSYATSANPVPGYSHGMAVQTIANMNGGYTVDFYNERNLGAPPSGVAPMSPGYTVMLWVGGASALVIFGCSFLVWRRRRRDWM